MTCHEFMSAAELLTPSQLLRMQGDGQPLSRHAQECASCGNWLESHRMLGNALQALRSSTEQRGASPAVEETVMQAFLAQGFAPRVVEMSQRNPRALLSVSRLFEIGAYAAAAAAIVVGLFLGVRLLEDRQASKGPAQAVSAAQTTSNPAKQFASNQESTTNVAKATAASTVKLVAAGPSGVAAKKPAPKVSEPDASAADRTGYTALMLCDPLICSGDVQVIRMELPARVSESDSGIGKPVLADVVIGEDGLVRAMRIVHE